MTPAEEAGIMKPPQTTPAKRWTLIKQKTDDELEHELNDMDLISNVEVPKDISKPKTQLDAFFLKHQLDQDANYDALARVAHMEPSDVRDHLKELGFTFPLGA